MRTLSLNVVNGLQSQRVKVPQANEPTFEGHREERQSRWNETHSAKRFSALLKLMETRWKETSGKKVKANVIVEMERKHVRIIQPEATDDSRNTTYGTFLEPLRSYRMTVTEGDGRVKPVSWINVWSRPHSAVCSHTLHNPCESCHCKCTLNEPPSIPRLAKVRCD